MGQGCNPLKNGTNVCLPNIAASEHYFVDFTQRTSLPPEWTLSDYSNLAFGPHGAEFTFKKRHDAVQIWTNSYIFFGKVDIVMQATLGIGMISNAVLMSDDLDEIDWEWSGNNFGDVNSQGKVQTNYFGKGVTGRYDRGTTVEVQQPQARFHTYSFDWNPDRIIWSIDGSPIRTFNYYQSDDDMHQYPQTPCKLQLGIWSGGDPDTLAGVVAWAGGYTDLAKAPYTMYLQSVSITNYNPGAAYNWTDSTGRRASINILREYSPPQRSTSSSSATTTTAIGPCQQLKAKQPSTSTAPTWTVGGTTSMCYSWHVVSAGDSCSGIQAKYSISNTDFWSWNSGLDENCYILLTGMAYCVCGRVSDKPPSTSSSSIRGLVSTDVETNRSTATATEVSQSSSIETSIDTGSSRLATLGILSESAQSSLIEQPISGPILSELSTEAPSSTSISVVTSTDISLSDSLSKTQSAFAPNSSNLKSITLVGDNSVAVISSSDDPSFSSISEEATRVSQLETVNSASMETANSARFEIASSANSETTDSTSLETTNSLRTGTTDLATIETKGLGGMETAISADTSSGERADTGLDNNTSISSMTSSPAGSSAMSEIDTTSPVAETSASTSSTMFPSESTSSIMKTISGTTTAASMSSTAANPVQFDDNESNEIVHADSSTTNLLSAPASSRSLILSTSSTPIFSSAHGGSSATQGNKSDIASGHTSSTIISSSFVATASSSIANPPTFLTTPIITSSTVLSTGSVLVKSTTLPASSSVSQVIKLTSSQTSGTAPRVGSTTPKLSTTSTRPSKEDPTALANVAKLKAMQLYIAKLFERIRQCLSAFLRNGRDHH